MRVLIKDDGKEYRYENVQKVSVVNNDLVIRYIDKHDEQHCETGKIPNKMLILG